MTTKLVGLLLYLMSFELWALVPLEGVVYGEVGREVQRDPLDQIFVKRGQSHQEANQQIKSYQKDYDLGQKLVNSCPFQAAPRYSNSFQSDLAKRSVVASLQYLGLDRAIKSIAYLSKKADVSTDDYHTMINRLVKSSCSENLTVYSHRLIRQNFISHFEKTDAQDPTLFAQYVPQQLVNQSKASEATVRSLHWATEVFRSLCSWGGDVENYRLLPPYLADASLMGWLINEFEKTQVSCRDFICRHKINREEFLTSFPRTVGSSSLRSDLERLYCHHFRLQTYVPSENGEQFKKWLKEKELEHPLLEVSWLHSQFTQVPFLWSYFSTFQDARQTVMKSWQEHFDRWAQNQMQEYSLDLYYEEPLLVKVLPLRDAYQLKNEGLQVKLEVGVGEIDALSQEKDKIKMSFDLKVSKNYLRWMKTRWSELVKEIDEEGQQAFKKQVSEYLEAQLELPKKMMTLHPWNDRFSRVLADEILGQVLAYRGNLFNSYQDQMLTIPIKFHYGPMSLQYLRTKSEIKKSSPRIDF